MNVVIYSKDNCIYCDRAKAFFRSNNMPFSEVKIGKDIIAEEFVEQYPDQKTVPLIFVDGEKIGGYQSLVEWWDNRPQLLTE